MNELREFPDLIMLVAIRDITLYSRMILVVRCITTEHQRQLGLRALTVHTVRLPDFKRLDGSLLGYRLDEWRINGRLYRENGPAMICVIPLGNNYRDERILYRNGKFRGEEIKRKVAYLEF